MSIRSLSYFLTVAEEMNITAAAQKLYITQQTLSSHIKRLEEQYGVVLFERKPRLRLTPAGERMVHYATRIVRLERMMNAEFVDISQKHKGVLLVGCSRTRARYFFPDVWNIYRTTCPGIEIRMKETSSRDMTELLLSRKLDICIGLNTASHPGLTQEVLMKEGICFMIHRSLFQHHFKEAASETLNRFSHGIQCSDILGIPLILQTTSNYVRQTIDRYFGKIDMIPQAIFETNDSEMIFEMCLSGGGAALLPETAIFLHENQDKLLKDVYVFPLLGPELETVILYPSDRKLSRYEQVFVDTCRRIFSDRKGAL